MLGRPAPLWILAVLGTIGGLLCTIVVLQFAEVIPWAGHEATHIGGRWTGVVSYGLAAVLFLASAFAWITVKRWAHMISILAAIVGFFVSFISYMDDTDPRSSAIAPIVVSVLMLFMVFRPSTNRAMAAVLAGQGAVEVQKAPPPKPLSAARKRELAKEGQKKAKATTPSVPAAAQPSASTARPNSTSTVATSAAAMATAASATVSQAVSALPKTASGTIPKAAAAAPVRPAFAGMAKSAAAMLGKSSGPSYKPLDAQPPAQPAAQAPAPAPPPASGLPANQPRPRGFRADDV